MVSIVRTASQLRGPNSWAHHALKVMSRERHRCASTPLLSMEDGLLQPKFGTSSFENSTGGGIDLYFKDESVHQSGSLKHRLARSLFLYKISSGQVRKGTTCIEASSGSTAISEAYFARLLGLPFVAVVASTTAKSKLQCIEKLGGKCVLVDAADQVYAEAQSIEAQLNLKSGDSFGGHYMDQFTNAERATDWKGNNNLAEDILHQLEGERYPTPSYVVVGAGTGGTATTLGRFMHYNHHDTQICVVDPENSVFYDCFRTGDTSLVLGDNNNKKNGLAENGDNNNQNFPGVVQRTGHGRSMIEGIGRPRVEPSFLPSTIDTMIRVPDAASYAAMHFLNELGISSNMPGASSGTNLYGSIVLIDELRRNGREGSIVTLICDRGDRYLDTYYNQNWLRENGFDLEPYLDQIREFWETGTLKKVEVGDDGTRNRAAAVHHKER